jgi:hypothetical protein
MWGVAVEAGWHITPSVSVSGEVVIPFATETVQQTAIPPERVDRQHGDLSIAALATVHTPPSRAGRFGVSVGGGLLRQGVTARFSMGSSSTVTFPPYGPDVDQSTWFGQFVAGAEYEVVAGTHVRIVPEFRLHALIRDRTADPIGRLLGLGSLIWRGAVTFRAAF